MGSDRAARDGTHPCGGRDGDGTGRGRPAGRLGLTDPLAGPGAAGDRSLVAPGTARGGAAAAAREPAARFRARRRARAGARPDPPREDGPPAGRAQAAAAAVLPAAGRAALPGPRRPGPGRALGHADERAGRGRARDPAAHRQGDDGPAGHQRRRRLHLGPGHRPGASRRPSGQHLVRGAGLPGRRAPAVHRGHALVQRRPELLRAQPALHLRSHHRDVDPPGRHAARALVPDRHEDARRARADHEWLGRDRHDDDERRRRDLHAQRDDGEHRARHRPADAVLPALAGAARRTRPARRSRPVRLGLLRPGDLRLRRPGPPARVAGRIRQRHAASGPALGVVQDVRRGRRQHPQHPHLRRHEPLGGVEATPPRCRRRGAT